MTSQRVTSLREGNGEGIFLSVEDWHEQVQINLGPNVGDITIEYKPPKRGRFMFIRIEAYEDKEYGALLKKLGGPEPKGGSGPIYINRHEICNLCCKLGKGWNQAGHVYEPASVFCKPLGLNLCI